MAALVDYLKELSDAAPNTPLVYYHYVDKTGVDVSIFDLIEECIAKVPTFAGVKFTGWDLGMVAQCLDVFGFVTIRTQYFLYKIEIHPCRNRSNEAKRDGTSVPERVFCGTETEIQL